MATQAVSAAKCPRGFLQVLGGQQLTPSAVGSGRRELAGWVADPKNPLTARVAVNRLWLHHFGSGLVRTPNDFGTRGTSPTHPELLDYLASSFMKGGWSIKAMHRQIMLSRTYQLASTGHPEQSRVDPSNDWLWKHSPRRLDAEAVRDSLLALSGELERGEGGAHPFPPPNDWKFSQHAPFNAVYESNRRSVYLMQGRLRKHPFLTLFDGPDANASTPDRLLTTTPVQALFWMNDPFVHRQAEASAKRVVADKGSENERLSRLYELVLSRPPTTDETQVARDYLVRFSEKLNDQAEQRKVKAWASLARVLLGGNEFLYID